MNLFATQPHGSADGGPNAPGSPGGSPPAASAKFFYTTGAQPLAGYTIKRGIGHGGFGEVYYATSDAGKEVALKLIRRNWDIELRGVMQCLNLKHPNLLSLYDVRQDAQGDNWVVMELMSGESLEDVINRHPNGLPLDEALAWIHGIAAGVAYLHDHGIVHRDLKPGNIFIDEGIVKIGDYGLSKFISCSRRSGQTGSVGTVHYMAPEIAKGRYGKEIDIYALGIILYEMLTGHVPFEGESVGEILMKHLTAEPDMSKLAEPYRTIVARTLAKDPASRFSSVNELIALLPPVPAGTATAATRFAGPSAAATQGVNMPSEAAHSTGFSFGQIVPPPLPNPAGGKPAEPSPLGRGQGEGAAPQQPGTNANDPFNKWYRETSTELSGWWQRQNFQPWQKVLIFLVGFFVVISVLDSLGSSSNVFHHANWTHIAIIAFVCYLIFHKRKDRNSRPYAANTGNRYSPAASPMTPGANRPAAAPSPAQGPVYTDFSVSPPPLPRHESLTRRRWKYTSVEPLYQPGTPRQRLTQLVGSLLLSAVIASVIALVAVILRADSAEPSQYAWLAATSVLGSWSVLAAAKVWEGRRGDPALRRFVMLAVGLAVGAVAFGLFSWLIAVLPNSMDQLDGPAQEFRAHFYNAGGSPQLIAFLAYFGFLFLTVRWWRMADPVRKTRFSIWLSAMTTLWAWLLGVFFLPFPQPWGLMAAATIAITVQLASPWLSPAERAQLPRAAEGG